MNFYDFFYLWESDGEDPLTMNTDDIELQANRHGFVYPFQMDGEDYSVNFGRTSINMAGTEIARNVYSVGFTGPLQHGLTDRGKPRTVYRYLLKAVKKLIEQENPEGLYFYGAYPAQDIMYAAFYQSYLHKVYTQVGRKDYLRNDYIEQLKAANDPRYAIIERGIEGEKNSTYIDTLKADKVKQRQRRLQMANSGFSEAINKIGWWSDQNRPVYITAVNRENSTIEVNYTSGRYSTADQADFTQVKKIDEMPNDPKYVRVLQRLVKQIQENGQEVAFWGTPPAGWDQAIDDPFAQLKGKFAQNSDGPIYINSYDEDSQEVSYTYVSGRHLNDTTTEAVNVKKIDGLDPSHFETLKKLIKLIKRDYEIQNVEFYGTPPQGWDHEEPKPEMVGKIAYVSGYGPVNGPVYVDPNGVDDDTLICWSAGRSGYLEDGHVRINTIEKIDVIPPEQLPKIKKLVKLLIRDGHITEPQFFGTPPAGWDQATEQQHPALGKVAYSGDYGPVYVRPEQSETQMEVDYFSEYGDNLRTGYVSPDDILPIDRMRPDHMPILRKLVAALTRQLGRQPQFYGTPPQGHDDHNNLQQAVGKIAWWQGNECAVLVKSIGPEFADVQYLFSSQFRSYNVPIEDLTSWPNIEPARKDYADYTLQLLQTALQATGVNAQVWGGN